MGFKTHKPARETIIMFNDAKATSRCEVCSKEIRSYYLDDEDRLAWSAWKTVDGKFCDETN